MEELDLKELLTIIWRKKISIIVIIVISVMLGLVYSYKYAVPKYESTATVILGKVSSTVGGDRWNENITISESDLSLNSSLILTYSELVSSRSIMEEVRDRLDCNITVDDIMESVKVTRVGTSDLLEVTATNTNPIVAKDIVTEVVDVFAEYVKEIYKIENVYIIDKPAIDNVPCNVNHIRDIAVSIAIGTFLSFVYLAVYAVVDNTIKSSSDVEDFLKVKTLINIPYDRNKKGELIAANDSKSIIAEAFKTLRTNIQFSNVDLKGAQTLLVTSCLPSEGKSYVSANLAISFAQVGKKVILVDSDMRRGRQCNIFNIPNTNGLSNYISNIDSNGMEINWSLGEYINKTQIKNLDLITAGSIPPNPAELLESARLAELIELLRNYYDIVIFDGAPILPITDSLLLGRVLEKVMLVAVSNKTKKDNLLKAKTSIEDVGGKVIGIALNKVAVSTGKYSDKYYYYYSADNDEKDIKEFIKSKAEKAKVWCSNVLKKVKSFKKRLDAGWIPLEKGLLEKRKAELAKQREVEKRIKVVEIEERARQSKLLAEEKARKEVELANAREAEKKRRDAERTKLLAEKARIEAEHAKQREEMRKRKLAEKKAEEAKLLERIQKAEEERAREDAIMAEDKLKEEAILAEEKARIEAEHAKQREEMRKRKLAEKRAEEAKLLERIQKAEEERAREDAIMAEEKAKEEAMLAQEKARREAEIAKQREEEAAKKLEMKKQKMEENARKRKENQERRAKLKAEWNDKFQAFKGKTLAKKDELSEEFKIKREEYIKRYNEYKVIKAEENKKKKEEKAKREAEIAKIREQERIRREEQRKIQAEERAKQLALQAEEKAKREAEIARVREQERFRKEEERRILAQERAKQIALEAEEKARREEELKYTDEYLQDNLYPKTKFSKL